MNTASIFRTAGGSGGEGGSGEGGSGEGGGEGGGGDGGGERGGGTASVRVVLARIGGEVEVIVARKQFLRKHGKTRH